MTQGKAGVDAKWLPNAGTIVDATLNPDFSQVESDVVQIGVNERFALFYPEKRPFFLEQVDLLQTPSPAIYTRTITNPFWGARLTGRQGSSSYTVLASNDRGVGTVIDTEFLGHDVLMTIDPAGDVAPIIVRQHSLDTPSIDAKVRIEVIVNGEVLK